MTLYYFRAEEPSMWSRPGVRRWVVAARSERHARSMFDDGEGTADLVLVKIEVIDDTTGELLQATRPRRAGRGGRCAATTG